MIHHMVLQIPNFYRVYNAQNNPRISDEWIALGKKLDVNALFSEQVEKKRK